MGWGERGSSTRNKKTIGSLRARRAASGKRGISTSQEMSKALRLHGKCLLVSGCGGVLTLSHMLAGVSAPPHIIKHPGDVFCPFADGDGDASSGGTAPRLTRATAC